MLDLNLNPTSRMLRQFAGAWLLVVSGLGVNQWLLRGHARLGATLIAAAAVVGVTGLLRPRAVRWLFVAMTIAAFPIGWVVSQVMLLVLFAGIITPVALLFKAVGRDRLSRKRNAAAHTFWRPKAASDDVRRYLRQY